MSKVLVPGVFDVFHIGHLNYLLAASREGDELIVAVQEDRAVKCQKGVSPVTSLAERIALIEQLRFVSAVVSYSSVFQGALLAALKINVFACGDEYGQNREYPDQLRTLEYCAIHDVRVVHIPRTSQVSSTSIRAKLQSFWASRAAKQADLPAGVTTLGSFGGDQEKMLHETTHECGLIEKCAERSKARSLIDLGCGDGRHLATIARKFDDVTGVDSSTELIAIASQKKANFPHVHLYVADVAEFQTEKYFDLILLSGITPSLDDEQFERLLEHIGEFAHQSSQLLLRTSIAMEKRFDLVNFFSPELDSFYSAYYRTKEEIMDAIQSRGWSLHDAFPLYQHRADSAVWWFEFERRNQM